jgi:carbamoyltransferase
MNVLGLFGPGPNPAAALVRDGVIVAFVEEERLSRIKTAPDSFPVRAARECLALAQLSLDDIDGIAYGWDSVRYARDSAAFFDSQREQFGDNGTYGRLQEAAIVNAYHPDRIRQTLQIGLGDLSRASRLPAITFYPHHLCHAASAFYCSGFDATNILTLDGSGEEITTLIGVGTDRGIEVTDTYALPHTLGGFYATFTEFCGFRPDQDEGKLMALASYGRYSADLQKKLDEVIEWDPETGHFAVNPSMRYVGGHTYGSRYTDEFVALFGPRRDAGSSALTGGYPDLAFAVQWRLEQIVTSLARAQAGRTGLSHFALAGGVAMNCVLNGRLATKPFVENLFVQPAASDNGVALGAAMLLARECGDSPAFRMTHTYYGREYSEAEILRALGEAKVPFRKSSDVCRETASYLANDKIVAWFQGRMEVGARSLGNRSILANPLNADMRDKLNREVKHRENWRPFCPSMKEESYLTFMDAPCESRFMILACPVVPEFHDKVPGIVHVDKTARPQAVARADNPRFWKLLDEFEQLTGYGILINTSFNIQGEPIVYSPRDALRTFGGTGLDVLVMGDYIVTKAG